MEILQKTNVQILKKTSHMTERKKESSNLKQKIRLEHGHKKVLNLLKQ